MGLSMLRVKDQNAQKQSKKYVTSEEYLALEETAEYKSEYHQGDTFTMAGGSSNHNIIVSNINGQMALAFKAKDCVSYMLDMRLWIEANGLFTYPDLFVVCGKREFYQSRKDTITNPSLIMEVLSDSTENYDRGNKFVLYRSIPTLREYIMIDQYKFHLEQFSLGQDGKWNLTEYNGPNSILHCSTIDFQIPLREIYNKVEFESE